MATLIAVDGPAFTGKSSLLIPTIKAAMEAQGIEVLTSHEPSSTLRGKEIQKKIYESAKQLSAIELAKLFNESRKIHLEDVVLPFMQTDTNKPKVCLLDRYATSTLVFQGLEGGAPISSLLEMETQTIGEMIPSVYLILVFPESNFETILESRRLSGARDLSRNKTFWHSADTEKQLKRHKHYLELDQIYRTFNKSRKIKYLDGSQKPSITMTSALKEISQNLSSIELQGKTEIEFRREMLGNYMKYVKAGGIEKIMENWDIEQERIKEKKFLDKQGENRLR